MAEWTARIPPIVIEAETYEEASEQINAMFSSDVDFDLLPSNELAKALEFYADPESYFAIFITPDRPAGQFADDVGCCLFDGEHDHRHGRSARKALGDEWGGTTPCDEQLEWDRTYRR